MVEDQVLVFKVFPLERVQQRRLPLRNAFLSKLWSRSLTLFQVDVFMVLSQDKVHLLLTLQLVLKNALMSLVKVFFAPSSKKKVRSWLHNRVPRVPASASPSTLVAQLVVEPVQVSTEWVQLRDVNSGKPYYWNRRARASVWKAPAGVEVVWVGTRDDDGSPLLLAQGLPCQFV